MSGVPLRARSVDLASAQAAIRASLCLPLVLGDTELDYETLRAVAWASTDGCKPVHVRTLLDRAMDAHTALTVGAPGRDEETLREDLRSKLVALSRLGDIAELDGGRWISVPGVRVHVPGDEPDLLVSGIPLCRMAPQTRLTIECHGAARVIRDTADSAPDLPSVRLEDWSRRPPGTLEQWTRVTLATPVPSTDTDRGVGLQLYAPSRARPGAYQAERWDSPGSVPDDGIHLARRMLAKHWRSYSLVRVESRQVTGVWEIDPLSARRLMYGIDQLAHNPTIAQWDESGQRATLRLRNPLPAPETRALLALARSTSVQRSGSWQVGLHRNSVRKLLDGLGISLTSER